AAHTLDQVGAQPAGLGLGKRRDDHAADAEELQCVQRGGERVRVADQAGDHEICVAEAVEDLCEVCLRRLRCAAVGPEGRNQNDEQVLGVRLGKLGEMPGQLRACGGAG